MNINYLNTPIENVLDPPIQTTLQELPLEKLSWEDFEKLCLAIVQIDHEINDCEIIGTKGQAQEGIDIYARQTNGKYYSYQCKRYQDIKVTDLQEIVDHFRKKQFYSKSTRFYLCTSCGLNKSQLQLKFELLKNELLQEGIELIKYDKVQLCRILKEHPKIVFDFFGTEWVKVFNGKLLLKEIPRSKKLDATAIIKYRKELYHFYSTIFNTQDPGILINEIDSQYSIQERFILPDILTNFKELNFNEIQEQDPFLEDSKVDLLQSQLFDIDYLQTKRGLRRKQKQKEYSVLSENSSVGIRTNADEALVNSSRNIIIGDPGTGKSTLLRYLVLDILGTNPKLNNVSKKYGKLLPVWLPFAFITKQLSADDTLSISQILRLWFNSYNRVDLFDLAVSAMEDERLLFIIDGIDEWNNIASAQQAITRIESIRALYDSQIIYSSRPYGFKLLKGFFSNLSTLSLAGFSNTQQKEFAEKWFTKWVSSSSNRTIDPSFVSKQVENFELELRKAGDLKKLAETPLLLGILIIQKIKDSALPKNKLDALKEITQYLIDKHPIRRSVEAGIVLDNDDINFSDIFCELAIYIQTESNDGVITKDDACKTITNYLVDYAGYSVADAKKRSRKIVEVGANNFGIIVEKSSEEISFGHKQFQEFLAARYLLESDDENAKEFIDDHASNPLHHQVIYNLFGLIHTKQVKRFNSFFETLKHASFEIYQEDYLTLISYEIALTLENAPIDIVFNSFQSITKAFEYETDEMFKEALLHRLLEGLENSKLRDIIVDYLIQYLPNNIKYSDPRIHAIKYLKDVNERQIEFLKKAFINGNTAIRYEVSKTLKKHIKEPDIFYFVERIIKDCANPEIHALAINTVVTDSLDSEIVDVLLEKVQSDQPMNQFFLYKYLVLRKRHKKDDLFALIKTASQLPFDIMEEITGVLIDGYSESEELKQVCIDSINKEKVYGEGNVLLDKEIAWKILFHCFNQDSAVIELIHQEFEEEEYPFNVTDPDSMLRHLTYYFNDNKSLIQIVEKWWLAKQRKDDIIDPQLLLTGIYIRTEDVKQYLLRQLKRSSFSHNVVMALLECWPESFEIKETLKVFFRTASLHMISTAAHYASEIFEESEKDEAIKILENILFKQELMFRERAIVSLIKIDKTYFEDKILPKFLEEIDLLPKDLFGQYYYAVENIIEHYDDNELVKAYLNDRIKKDKDIFLIVAKYSPHLISEKHFDLNSSMPLSPTMRRFIIERFYEKDKLPEAIEKAFCNFQFEGDNGVKSDMAVCLFKHLKSKSKQKIIDLCRPLVFAKGYSFDKLRNIAFNGYMVAENLEEYFSLEDEEKGSGARPFRRLNEYEFKSTNHGLTLKSLIDNFGYLISYVGNDFALLGERENLKRNNDFIWNFLADHTFKASPTLPYILEYIESNQDRIDDARIIRCLNRTTPKSPILKKILLQILESQDTRNQALAGMLLGKNFNNDSEVYESIIKIDSIYDSGRIVALCNGWPNDPKLKEIYDKIILDEDYSDNDVIFHLQFLFTDATEILLLLDNIFDDIEETKYYHKFFFVPLLERLKRDEKFANVIKESLLGTDLIDLKISCYNLLSLINRIDDDIIRWKEGIMDFKNDYGYDVVSNRTVRLKHILHDYYF